jgi:hypothetical protein
MKIKIIYGVLSVFILSGCAMVGTPDEEGWRSSQKAAFLKILASDNYFSICDQQPLYQKVKESEDSRLMSRLMVAYTKNLANGCIDLGAFSRSQKSRQDQNISTTYETYLQEVRAQDILAKVRAGISIEDILEPYVPPYKAFSDLGQSYTTLKEHGNVSGKTLSKIRLNIERVKLMKPDLGEKYVLVNIPEYKVRIIENQQTKLSMRVIVGQRRLQTPIFSAPLQFIAINPQWRVPDSIARNEVIPGLLKDPEYLAKEHLMVRKSYDMDSEEVNASSVDWATYLEEEKNNPDMTYKFIEAPSQRNVLGRVKFLFPNTYHVYMHDTQTKKLFERSVRAFSHGCIRLQKPIDMLGYLSKNYTNRSEKEIKEIYDSMQTKYIPFSEKLPVHTAYLTAYLDEAGDLLLFDDVYGFDRSQKLTF